MPKSFSQVEFIQITVKLPPKTLSFVRKRAEEIGSQAEAVREAIEAVHTFFGLPDLMANALREDAKRQGKDDLGYVRELLAKRYQDLLLDQPRATKK